MAVDQRRIFEYYQTFPTFEQAKDALKQFGRFSVASSRQNHGKNKYEVHEYYRCNQVKKDADCPVGAKLRYNCESETSPVDVFISTCLKHENHDNEAKERLDEDSKKIIRDLVKAGFKPGPSGIKKFLEYNQHKHFSLHQIKFYLQRLRNEVDNPKDKKPEGRRKILKRRRVDETQNSDEKLNESDSVTTESNFQFYRQPNEFLNLRLKIDETTQAPKTAIKVPLRQQSHTSHKMSPSTGGTVLKLKYVNYVKHKPKIKYVNYNKAITLDKEAEKSLWDYQALNDIDVSLLDHDYGDTRHMIKEEPEIQLSFEQSPIKTIQI